MATELKNHTVTAFDQDLKKINKSLYDMNELVVGSMKLLKESLSNQTSESIQNARDIDNKINEIEKQVETLSTNIIALRHPMAVDLRFVISAIKVSTMVERQGDIIEKAVRKVLAINPNLLASYRIQLEEIADMDIEMLSHAIRGFNEQDIQEANKVWRLEDKVDDYCDALFDRIKSDIRSNPNEVDHYISLMLVVRALERMADYCTKITKALHYVTSGERVSEKDF